MHKFNVGDRVVYICKNPDNHDRQYKLYAGMTGTVIKAGFDTGCIGIAFDNYTFGNGKYHNEVHVNNTDITIYTPKFKTGDRVELINANFERYGGGVYTEVFDARKRYRGTVLYLTGNLVTVRFDDFHNGWSHGRNNNKDCYIVSGTNLKRIKKEKYKFNIGDRVKCSALNYGLYNHYGTIINISKGVSDIFYLVEFDTSYSFLHNGDLGKTMLVKGERTGKPKHCWYLKECDLEKLNIISDGFNTYDADSIMA